MDSLRPWIKKWLKKFYNDNYNDIYNEFDSINGNIGKKVQLIEFKKSIKIKEILEPDIVKDEDIDIQWAFVSDKELIVPCYFTHSSIKNFMEENEMRLTQSRGAIVSLVEWKPKIDFISTSKDKPGLYLWVQKFRLVGCIGEPRFGDPIFITEEQLINDFASNYMKSKFSVPNSDRIRHPNPKLFRHPRWPNDFELNDDICNVPEDQLTQLKITSIYDPDINSNNKSNNYVSDNNSYVYNSDVEDEMNILTTLSYVPTPTPENDDGNDMSVRQPGQNIMQKKRKRISTSQSSNSYNKSNSSNNSNNDISNSNLGSNNINNNINKKNRVNGNNHKDSNDLNDNINNSMVNIENINSSDNSNKSKNSNNTNISSQYSDIPLDSYDSMNNKYITVNKDDIDIKNNDNENNHNIIISSQDSEIPFDSLRLRNLPYQLSQSSQQFEQSQKTHEVVTISENSLFIHPLSEDKQNVKLKIDSSQSQQSIENANKTIQFFDSFESQDSQQSRLSQQQSQLNSKINFDSSGSQQNHSQNSQSHSQSQQQSNNSNQSHPSSSDIAYPTPSQGKHQFKLNSNVVNINKNSNNTSNNVNYITHHIETSSPIQSNENNRNNRNNAISISSSPIMSSSINNNDNRLTIKFRSRPSFTYTKEELENIISKN